MVAISVTIALGFIAVVGFFAQQHTDNIHKQNERTMHKLGSSISYGLRTPMMSGHSDVAELYAQRLKSLPDIIDFRIMRHDGLEAFRDNRTIDAVNTLRGDVDFAPRKTETEVRVLPADDPNLRRIFSERNWLQYYGRQDGASTLTFLWPIVNDRECHRCHDKAHDTLGALQLTTSLRAAEEAVRQTWHQAGLIILLAIIGTVVILGFLLRRSVVAPIKSVLAAMQRVTSGDMSQQVPIVGKDELSHMASSFNTLLRELNQTYVGFQTQHDKLETIIQGSRDGIVVTNSTGDIVLVNAAATRMIGHPAEAVIARGFLHLLDAPERMQAMLDGTAPDGDSDLFLHGEYFIAVRAAAIRSPDGRLIGQAALLRNITEEKRLEEKLRILSSIDGLTGLYNRRLLDEILEREVRRTAKHGNPLSILMFDVDHFKKFNDTYGHDQGDRVLQAVAAQAKAGVRTVDSACRYGGEEFLLVLVETPAEGAMVVGERIRLAIETMRVDDLQVTISIGVAEAATLGVATAQALVEAADGALYESKRGGRNRVTLMKPKAADGSV